MDRQVKLLLRLAELLGDAEDQICSDDTHIEIDHGRTVVVLDKGWIFVGDLQGSPETGWKMKHVSNVRKWDSNGFGGMTKDPTGSGAVLDPCNDLEFSDRSVIFRVPVEW